MTRKVKILGIQINPKTNDKTANYQKVSRFLQENADFEPDLVVLPEMFNIGLDYDNFVNQSECIPDATTMFLSGFAEKYNTNIVGGSFVEKCHDNTYKNTTLVFDRTGKIVGKYQKIHLFSHCGSKEHHYLTKGEKTLVLDLDFGKIGVAICYDLRFPELFRNLMKQGAELVVVPSAWPHPRLNHWRIFNRTRALENLNFLVSVNQCGESASGIINLGSSMLINPWGEILEALEGKEGVLKYEIDLDEVAQIRKETPFIDDIVEIK